MDCGLLPSCFYLYSAFAVTSSLNMPSIKTRVESWYVFICFENSILYHSLRHYLWDCFYKYHVVLQNLGVTMDFQPRIHRNLRESPWESESKQIGPLISRSPPPQTLSSMRNHTSSKRNTSSSLNRVYTMSLLSAYVKHELYSLSSSVLNTPQSGLD